MQSYFNTQWKRNCALLTLNRCYGCVLMYCRADNLSQNISHTHCEQKAISADLIVTSNNTMSYFLQYCVSLSIYLFIPSYLSLFIFMLHRQIIDPGAKLRAHLTSPRTSPHTSLSRLMETLYLCKLTKIP